MESTTTSLHAVLKEPNKVATTAAAGDLTVPAIASHEVVPALRGLDMRITNLLL